MAFLLQVDTSSLLDFTADAEDEDEVASPQRRRRDVPLNGRPSPLGCCHGYHSLASRSL